LTSPDVFPPNLFDPPTLHRYVYVTNDPINFVDPSGRFETAAGLMVTVSLGQMLDFIAPTFIQGGIVLGGVVGFMKPGFELRNLAFEMMLTQHESAMEYALEVYRNAHLMIQLGAVFIDSTNTAVGLTTGFIQGGLGVVKFARALQSVPRGSLTMLEITRIDRFESIAIRIETEGLSLFARVQRSSSVTIVRSLVEEFSDWSNVIAEGVQAARALLDLYMGIRYL
jgi:hypothetical protein